MAFKMKGDPYKMGKMATKSSMAQMKTSYKMKKAMDKTTKSPDKDGITMKGVTKSPDKDGITMKSPMEQGKTKFTDKLKAFGTAITSEDGLMTSGLGAINRAKSRYDREKKKYRKTAADKKKSGMKQKTAEKAHAEGLAKFSKQRKVRDAAEDKGDVLTANIAKASMGKTRKEGKAAQKATIDRRKSMAKMKKGEAMKMKKESMAKQTKKQKEKLPAGLVKEIAKKAGKAGTEVAREGIKAAGSKVAGKKAMTKKLKSAMPQKKKAKRKLSVADKLKAARSAVSTSKGPFGDSNFMDRYRDEKKNIRKGTYKGDSFKTG